MPLRGFRPLRTDHNKSRRIAVTTRLVGLDQDTHAATDGSTSEEGGNEKTCHSSRNFLQKAPDEHRYVGYAMVCRPAGQGTPKVRMVLATRAQRTRFTDTKMVESTWSKLTDLKALLSFSKSPDWVNMGQSCDLRTGLPKALQQANQGCKE